jgi:hypothetical protein
MIEQPLVRSVGPSERDAVADKDTHDICCTVNVNDTRTLASIMTMAVGDRSHDPVKRLRACRRAVYLTERSTPVAVATPQARRSPSTVARRGALWRSAFGSQSDRSTWDEPSHLHQPTSPPPHHSTRSPLLEPRHVRICAVLSHLRWVCPAAPSIVFSMHVSWGQKPESCSLSVARHACTFF